MSSDEVRGVSIESVGARVRKGGVRNPQKRTLHQRSEEQRHTRSYLEVLLTGAQAGQAQVDIRAVAVHRDDCAHKPSEGVVRRRRISLTLQRAAKVLSIEAAQRQTEPKTLCAAKT